ncbi:MAG: 30S ribosomal protein S20 [bacterium]|nr:30S ribosomal protein S20 [bacterium]
MPITKSATKAQRQSIKRKARNLKRKNAVKDIQKKFQRLLTTQKLEEAKAMLPQLTKAIDKAVKAKVLKKNTGARKKSRASRLASPRPSL